MAQFLAPIINEQTMDANGDPLVGGTISVYLAGSSTPAATTSDQAGLVPNTFPITLNSLGLNSQGAIWLTGGLSYKFVIKDASAATLRTIDNVSGMNDTTVALDQWVLFQGAPTYVSATSFTLAGDQTQTFPFGRRIKTINTSGIVYSTVVRSVFGATTTVTVVNDSGVLDSGLSSVSVGLITTANPSLPATLTTPPFRNRLFNGQFRLDNRGTGGGGAITAGAAVRYTVDRWYVACTGANITATTIAGTGYQNAYQFAGAVGVTTTLLGQRIESLNCVDWVNKQIFVQVPISATGISTVTWNAYVANATDNWAAKTLLATGTLNLTSSVEVKYFTFNAGANAARGIAIEFVTGPLVAAQSIVYQGEIQAEATQLSPFEVVDIGQEIIRCKRYLPYWRSTSTNDQVGVGQATSTTVGLVSYAFDVEARVAATTIAAGGAYALTTAAGAASTASAVAVAVGGKRSVLLSVTVGAVLAAGNATTMQCQTSTGLFYFSNVEL